VFVICGFIYQFVRITGRRGAFRILAFDSIRFFISSSFSTLITFLCWLPQSRPFSLWPVMMDGVLDEMNTYDDSDGFAYVLCFCVREGVSRW